MSHTRLKALTVTPSSFWSTSDFVQKNSERFCTHSKYETVTPPPFARMSGIRRIPRLWKMSSASDSVASVEVFLLSHLTLFGADTNRHYHKVGPRQSPPGGPADREGLARDDAGDGEALRHRDRVHDPRHRLAVRVDVRCGDVLL